LNEVKPIALLRRHFRKAMGFIVTTTTSAVISRNLPESIELGTFTLLIYGEDERSGESLAKEVRTLITQEFAKRERVLSLLYELEIEEFYVGLGCRRSKNRAKLKQKKGRTLREKLLLAGAGIVTLFHMVSFDYSHIHENLDFICVHVVKECNARGKKVEILDKEFYRIDLSRPSDDTSAPDDNHV
jgi:hypothetical protein